MSKSFLKSLHALAVSYCAVGTINSMWEICLYCIILSRTLSTNVVHMCRYGVSCCQVDRQANTLPRRMVTLTVPTPEQRNSYELQFSNLHPVGGYVTGELMWASSLCVVWRKTSECVLHNQISPMSAFHYLIWCIMYVVISSVLHIFYGCQKVHFYPSYT